MKGTFAALGLVATLTGCVQEPLTSTATNNQKFQVDELFTHDGVTIYRFRDGGNPVYFGSKNGDSYTSRTENCGKACTRSVTTQTIGLN